MQSEVLGEKDSDCHSTKTIELILSEKDMEDFMYRYIVEDGKEICLTPDVAKKYVGKTIHLRSPMYCTDDDTCNICAGDMSYKMGTKNVGLNASSISTRLLNLSMKKFQISVVKSSVIDIDDIFL